MAFALAAAALFGSADFLGGVASRRARAASVVVVSAPAGVVVIFAAAMLTGVPFQRTGLGWAAAAGAAGGAGLIIFYAGLGAGPMSVVAPVSALVSTVVPVGGALAMGERAGTAVYTGAALCLVAIVLVSMEGSGGAGGSAKAGGPVGSGQPGGTGPGQATGHHATARAVGYGAASGLAFGIFFLFIRVAGTAGVLWPVCVARVAGSVVVLCAAAWLGTRPPGRGAGRWVLPAAVGAGILDASANVCYLLAARAGLFGVAVVITSLYPGITVLLARATLGERMRVVQQVGLVLAAAGVALVTF